MSRLITCTAYWEWYIPLCWIWTGFYVPTKEMNKTEESIFSLLWLACSPPTLSDSFLLHDSEAPGLEGYMARATLPSW